MKKVTAKVSTYYSFEYDEHSEEFQEAFSSFNEVINKTTDTMDMLNHVANSIDNYGVSKMVEGVGFVAIANKKKPEEYCGITVNIDEDYTEVEFM